MNEFLRQSLRTFDQVIENVIINGEDQTLEVIIRTPSNIMYACYPPRAAPDKIEKLIFHVKDGLIMLKETKIASIKPATEESYTFEE